MDKIQNLVSMEIVTQLQEVLRCNRPWFHREFYKYPIHDAVVAALGIARPDDWHQLVLEHPHKSVGDITMIAFTRDDKNGEADRQVKTTIGKYLRRHFSTLADHEIRDIQALHTATGCKVVVTMAEMLFHLLRGPNSCMKSQQFNVHPYEVYDPALGWSMAVREQEGDTVARALIHTSKNGDKTFVRSYNKDPNGGYSHSDTQLEAWMQAQGICKVSGWDGAKIKVIEHNGDVIGPFIDGNDRDVSYSVDSRVTCRTFTICEDGGDYRMDNTGGYASEQNQCDHTCEDCGEGFDDGDGYWVGYDEDRYICGECCNNDYVWATGRRGNSYYIRDRYSVEVNGDYYDEDYLSDNDIVEDVDGEYCHRDDVVYIDSEDNYYGCNDERICLAEDTSEYLLRDDCWQCTNTDRWYSMAEAFVEINGDKYHPENVPSFLSTTATQGESE